MFRTRSCLPLLLAAACLAVAAGLLRHDLRQLALLRNTFVLATGRPPRWLPQVVDQLPVAPLAVCANGAVIMDTDSGEFLATSLLDPETLAAIDEVLRRLLPGSGIAAERLGADAADADFVASPDYEHAWIHPAHLEVGHDEVLSEPVLKLLARVPGMPSADMVAALRGEVDHLADLTYSTTDGLIEFAARGVTKASGLSRIAAGTAAGAAVPSAEENRMKACLP